MDFLENVPDYEKTILLVAAMDRGLTFPTAPSFKK